MYVMQSPRRRLPVVVRSAALLGLSFVASAASARDDLSVDLSAQAGVSTNPFLNVGPASAAGVLTLGVRPTWLSTTELTTVEIDGYAEIALYSKGHSATGNASVQGSATHRLSERTTVSASLGYTNTIVGSYNGFGGPLGIPVTSVPGISTGSAVGSVPATGAGSTVGSVPLQVTTPTQLISSGKICEVWERLKKFA